MSTIITGRVPTEYQRETNGFLSVFLLTDSNITVITVIKTCEILPRWNLNSSGFHEFWQSMFLHLAFAFTLQILCIYWSALHQPYIFQFEWRIFCISSNSVFYSPAAAPSMCLPIQADSKFFLQPIICILPYISLRGGFPFECTAPRTVAFHGFHLGLFFYWNRRTWWTWWCMAGSLEKQMIM